jgi:hypothetical protein
MNNWVVGGVSFFAGFCFALGVVLATPKEQILQALNGDMPSMSEKVEPKVVYKEKVVYKDRIINKEVESPASSVMKNNGITITEESKNAFVLRMPKASALDTILTKDNQIKIPLAKGM